MFNQEALLVDIKEAIGEGDLVTQMRLMVESEDARIKFLEVIKKHIPIPKNITGEVEQVVYCMEQITGVAEDSRKSLLALIEIIGNLSLRADGSLNSIWAPEPAKQLPLNHGMTGPPPVDLNETYPLLSDNRGIRDREVKRLLGLSVDEARSRPTVVRKALPKDHWLFQPMGDSPAPYRVGYCDLRVLMAKNITAAAKFAIKSTTDGGVVPNFDPDDMVNAFIIGLLGYNTPSGDKTYDINLRAEEPAPPLDHAKHGKGSAEHGPDDNDCPCRGTLSEAACAEAGCGFCRSLRKAIRYAIDQDSMIESVGGKWLFPLAQLEELLKEYEA